MEGGLTCLFQLSPFATLWKIPPSPKGFPGHRLSPPYAWACVPFRALSVPSSVYSPILSLSPRSADSLVTTLPVTPEEQVPQALWMLAFVSGVGWPSSSCHPSAGACPHSSLASVRTELRLSTACRELRSSQYWLFLTPACGFSFHGSKSDFSQHCFIMSGWRFCSAFVLANIYPCYSMFYDVVEDGILVLKISFVRDT